MSAAIGTRWKNALLALSVTLLSLALLEGIARVFHPGTYPANTTYLEISQGFTDLDTLIADRHQGPGPKYFDEFIYGWFPITTGTVNFTDYFGARLTPSSAPMADAKNIVWAFGGSTMENTETTDDLSIANTWAEEFTRTLGPTHVKNFGTGGFFSSYQLIKFQRMLREVPESEWPTMAIFYDGYNDALFGFQYGPGKIQADLTLKLRALVETHNNRTLFLHATSRMLSWSRLWNLTGARAMEYLLFRLPEPNTDQANLEGALQVYERNVRMIQSTCEAFGIRCLFLLQPLIVTKTPLTDVERRVLDWLETHPRFGTDGSQFVRDFYAEAAARLAHEPHFIDASAILDGRSQADFYDLGHTGVFSAPVIGAATAGLIVERLAQ